MKLEQKYAMLQQYLDWCQQTLARALYVVMVQNEDYLSPGIVLWRKVYIGAMIHECIETRKKIDALLDQLDKRHCICAPGMTNQQALKRGRAAVARWAHNPQAKGSIPFPATKRTQSWGNTFPDKT